MGETSWSHDNKEWQKTLDLARELGWPPPTKTSNHGVLVLRCPTKDHKIRIFSTGDSKATERVAIQSRAKLRNCAHRDLTEPLAAIRTALDGAELLLDAAERLLDVAETDQSAQQALDALESIAIASGRLAEVEAMFDAAAQAHAEAELAVSTSVDSAQAQRPVGELVIEANSRLRDANLGLRDLPKKHPDWDQMRQRHTDLSERLAVVSARLRTV